MSGLLKDVSVSERFGVLLVLLLLLLLLLFGTDALALLCGLRLTLLEMSSGFCVRFAAKRELLGCGRMIPRPILPPIPPPSEETGSEPVRRRVVCAVEERDDEDEEDDDDEGDGGLEYDWEDEEE